MAIAINLVVSLAFAWCVWGEMTVCVTLSECRTVTAESSCGTLQAYLTVCMGLHGRCI